MQGLPGLRRLPGLQGLRRMRMRRRLLLVMGRLPHLLNQTASRLH
jgi:hypothetical protein